MKLILKISVLSFMVGSIVCDSPSWWVSAPGVKEVSFPDVCTSSLTIENSGKYNLVQAGQYSPTVFADASPMIKIVSSDVVFNGDHFGFHNKSTTHEGWIGLEIGWSPTELLADSSRIQPKNITVCNVSWYDFDCGVIIHAGVQSVTLKNCNFFDASLGIIALGKTDQLVEELSLINVKVSGHSKNHHVALESLKTIVETSYGYGADFFMKLLADPYNSNALDVYSYVGVMLIGLRKGNLENVNIHNIGYADFATNSEGNGQRTQAIGLMLKRTQRVVIDNIISVETCSEVKAVGMQMDQVAEIEINRGDISFATSKKKTVGIEVANEASVTYSAQVLLFNEVHVKGNVSDELVMGMDLSNTQGFHGKHLLVRFNKGGNQAYGIYSNASYTIDIQDSTLSENSATRTTNDVASGSGIMAAGFYGVNVRGLQLKKVISSLMQALNSAYGIYLKNSSSCRFEECQVVANSSVKSRSGEATDIRSQQDAQEISKYAAVVDAACTGGFGAYVTGCKYIKFEKCLATSNTGHRATGLAFVNCASVALLENYASAQQATGMMLDSTLYSDNAATPTAIEIKAVHRPLLFGDLTKTTVNAQATTDLFLSKMTAIRTAQLAGTTPAYSDVVTMFATSALLQAMIARYRLWGTAIGFSCHNGIGFLVKDCVCVGNLSYFDSGIGICVTGRTIDVTIEDCNCAFNTGGYASIIQPVTSATAAYKYFYNLVGLKLFWATVTSGLSSPFPLSAATDDLGISSTSTTFTARGNRNFGNGTTGEDVYVNLNGINNRTMVSPVGPVGAGIVLGDLILEGIVKGCSLYGNLGNAGHAHGALLDNAYSVTLENNNISGNISNIYGMAVGVMDVTAHSTNLFINNFLEGNKCSTFNNGNYLIPFNPADTNNLAFPCTVMMNGKFVNKATESDNVVMQYSQQDQFHSIEFLSSIPQHPDLISCLTAASCWA